VNTSLIGFLVCCLALFVLVFPRIAWVLLLISLGGFVCVQALGFVAAALFGY